MFYYVRIEDLFRAIDESGQPDTEGFGMFAALLNMSTSTVEIVGCAEWLREGSSMKARPVDSAELLARLEGLARTGRTKLLPALIDDYKKLKLASHHHPKLYWIFPWVNRTMIGPSSFLKFAAAAKVAGFRLVPSRTLAGRSEVPQEAVTSVASNPAGDVLGGKVEHEHPDQKHLDPRSAIDGRRAQTAGHGPVLDDPDDYDSSLGDAMDKLSFRAEEAGTYDNPTKLNRSKLRFRGSEVLAFLRSRPRNVDHRSGCIAHHWASGQTEENLAHRYKVTQKKISRIIAKVYVLAMLKKEKFVDAYLARPDAKIDAVKKNAWERDADGEILSAAENKIIKDLRDKAQGWYKKKGKRLLEATREKCFVPPRTQTAPHIPRAKMLAPNVGGGKHRRDYYYAESQEQEVKMFGSHERRALERKIVAAMAAPASKKAANDLADLLASAAKGSHAAKMIDALASITTKWTWKKRPSTRASRFSLPRPGVDSSEDVRGRLQTLGVGFAATAGDQKDVAQWLTCSGLTAGELAPIARLRPSVVENFVNGTMFPSKKAQQRLLTAMAAVDSLIGEGGDELMADADGSVVLGEHGRPLTQCAVPFETLVSGKFNHNRRAALDSLVEKAWKIMERVVGPRQLHEDDELLMALHESDHYKPPLSSDDAPPDLTIN